MDEVPESEQKLESKQADICVSYQPTAGGMMSRLEAFHWLFIYSVPERWSATNSLY